MYHQPPHPHHAKRRKKRPIHGLKTAEVTRGKSGYGFTISGQHPCILSCIVAGSPADCVGLKPGDYLVSVNGLDVSKAGHDEVVRMVGMSTGTLTLQVAENYNSSDSSDDEYNHRTKSSKYPNRVRVRSAARLRFEDKMDKIVAGLNQRDRHCPDGHSHDPTLRPLPQQETMHKHGHSRPRLHMPVGAENSEIAAVSAQWHQHGSSSDGFKVPFQKSYSVPNVERGSSKQAIERVEPKHAFIKSTSHSHRRSRQTGHREPSSHQHVYNNFSPASLQQIINHSLHSYTEANEAFILQTEDSDALSDSTDDDEELNLLPQNSNIKVIVGYIGSIEMPSDANVPHVRIQSIRNAVRRLRVEQKINTLVLMHVHQEGIALSNAAGSTVAEYPVDRIAFSGVCPDDKRFFGIVTLHSKDEPDGTVSHENFVRSSSCHVFMVDPEMNAHNIHAQKAKTFGIRCTVDPHSQRCLEFPRSTTPIILSISNLYQDRLEGALETDLARSQVFANPNRPAERSSSNSSNSDSGLGLGREDNGHDRAVGPDLQLEQPLPPSGQVRWSGNTIHLTHGPIRHLSPDIHTVSTLHHPLSALSTDANRSFHTSTSSDECFKAAEKLNVRAMSESVINSPASPKDILEKDYSAEILRQSMQKLFQARQKHTHEKQSTSDQDSQNLNENNSTKKKQVRPISAPFKCLSGESNVDCQQKVDSSKVESVEMNLADKLSPRAFLSSAFTPVGSASSAFRKVKSHSGSLTNQIRSPSAPPIPNYHGDDEDSDDDDVKLIIERFERDRALGLTVEAESRRFSEGSNMEKKRDPDKKNSIVNTEKWTKGGGSVRQKPRQRTSLSQSHESLVVIDTDPLNSHRLSAANSVNSIINHVKEEEEKEEVGRVAGWAVNFDKLLRDISGLHVFTEFLKKEFSEENIIFWTTVEKYKQITNQDLRKVQAKDIFNKHLSVRASEPVNIDSVARQQADSQMDTPTPQIFDLAQHQIYQLMKQDSYARFLKSELYKTCLIKEMEGKPLDVPQEENKKEKESEEKEKDSKKKSKGKENEDKEKRRRSLLPWRQKASKSSSKSSSDAESKKSKTKEKDKEAEVNNNRKSTSATTTLPSVTSNPIPSVGSSLSTTRNEEPAPDTDEQPKFCRVILPDGSTTVVCTRAGQTINIVLGKLCEKRNMTIASVDIFLLGSDKPLNLSEDISVLGSKEVIIEKRVLFRMDLPNKKSIGVKAKPNRVILDVFKPILHKYGLRIDSIEVYLSGHTAVLDLEGLVSLLDNQRVVVVSKDDGQGYQKRRSSIFGFIEKRVHRNGSKGTWEDKDETKGHICTPEERSQKTPKR
ncbi:hypothetical protein ACJMK2_005384 [Sinanodonta woodiana]|uniref:Regulator of G-protein signaling 12 n=1 Tax=Sinanodonta woodiana TaxID=1069815 RepID=A0ABD3VPY2_SINWO